MMYTVGGLYKTVTNLILLDEQPTQERWFVTIQVLKTGLNRIKKDEIFLLVECVLDELEPRKCYLQILYKEKLWWVTVLFLGIPSIEPFF